MQGAYGTNTPVMIVGAPPSWRLPDRAVGASLCVGHGGFHGGSALTEAAFKLPVATGFMSMTFPVTAPRLPVTALCSCGASRWVLLLRGEDDLPDTLVGHWHVRERGRCRWRASPSRFYSSRPVWFESWGSPGENVISAIAFLSMVVIHDHRARSTLRAPFRMAVPPVLSSTSTIVRTVLKRTGQLPVKGRQAARAVATVWAPQVTQ